MDYLFNTIVTDIPKGYRISCYYILDSHLRFISLYKTDYYYFHYIDSYKVGEFIIDSANEYDFDVYVFNIAKPIISQKSEAVKINGSDARVVEVVSQSGNPIIRKSRKHEEKNIITRYQTNGKKLF